MIFIWLSYDFHMTVIWFSYDCDMIFIWLSSNLHITVIWFSYHCFMIVISLLCDFHIIVIWSSYHCYMIVISPSCNHHCYMISHITVIWLSYHWYNCHDFYRTFMPLSYHCHIASYHFQAVETDLFSFARAWNTTKHKICTLMNARMLEAHDS